jgi:sulfide:quinone oxidoreductase
MSEKTHYNLLIIGGGTAGISVAARILKNIPNHDIAIIESAVKHYYQPGWTMVGGGIIPKEYTERNMSSVMPDKVRWIKDSAVEMKPDDNSVVTKEGHSITYDYLVIAAGIRIDWDRVKGLKENIGKYNICSIYDYHYSELTWKELQQFKGGTALFTQPVAPFKCPGAAQKIMYLADDTFRKKGVRSQSRVRFRSAGMSIFPVKKYADALNKVIERKELEVKYQHNLVEIRPESKEAVFQNVENSKEEVLNYDLLHVTPPMSAPDFIKKSPLGDADGWVDVDQNSLQHVRYPNIFGLGDVTNTPNSKTAAAIRAQMPILVRNLLLAMDSKPSSHSYGGYAACPLITGYGKLILAEFDYDLQPQETFPFDQSKERLSMYWFKRYALPWFYWNGLLKGKTYEMIG